MNVHVEAVISAPLKAGWILEIFDLLYKCSNMHNVIISL